MLKSVIFYSDDVSLSVYNLAVNKTIDLHLYSNAGTKIRWLLRKRCARVEYSWLFDLFEVFVWNESSHVIQFGSSEMTYTPSHVRNFK